MDSLNVVVEERMLPTPKTILNNTSHPHGEVLDRSRNSFPNRDAPLRDKGVMLISEHQTV